MPHFQKGSPEAKAHMARLREMARRPKNPLNAKETREVSDLQRTNRTLADEALREERYEDAAFRGGSALALQVVGNRYGRSRNPRTPEAAAYQAIRTTAGDEFRIIHDPKRKRYGYAIRLSTGGSAKQWTTGGADETREAMRAHAEYLDRGSNPPMMILGNPGKSSYRTMNPLSPDETREVLEKARRTTATTRADSSMSAADYHANLGIATGRGLVAQEHGAPRYRRSAAKVTGEAMLAQIHRGASSARTINPLDGTESYHVLRRAESGIGDARSALKRKDRYGAGIGVGKAIAHAEDSVNYSGDPRIRLRASKMQREAEAVMVRGARQSSMRKINPRAVGGDWLSPDFLSRVVDDGKAAAHAGEALTDNAYRAALRAAKPGEMQPDEHWYGRMVTLAERWDRGWEMGNFEKRTGRKLNPLTARETAEIRGHARNVRKAVRDVRGDGKYAERANLLGIADGLARAQYIAAPTVEARLVAGRAASKAWNRGRLAIDTDEAYHEELRRRNPSSSALTIRRGNPAAKMLPPRIANDPGFKRELAAYIRRHGQAPARVTVVNSPAGSPKYASAWGRVPELKYDPASDASNKGPRIHHMGEKGGTKPYLVSSTEKGPRYLGLLGGTFRAGGEWILR